MAEKELKPCPFCGGKAIVLHTKSIYELPHFFVTCGSCGVETPRVCKTEEQAREVWNRRSNNGKL